MMTAAAPAPTASDRRTAARHACGFQASRYLIASVADSLSPAWVHNISTGGVLMLLARPVEPGSLLAVKLLKLSHPAPSMHLVRVLHVREDAGGCYLVGGAFVDEVSEDDLGALLN
jgi:hypothetical protein